MISTNDSYRDIAIKRSGKEPADVTVVRTGPDPDRLKRGPADPELRRGRRFLAAYIGVMGPQDGVDIVVRAADIVVHELGRDDIAFTLIGSGDCFDELVALRDELELAGHVEFTGRAPDELVTHILSTADVGLSPDPKNPLNDVSTMNKTMEYMAFELPVVAFDLRETRVSAGDAAVYVTPNDVREYAKAIVDLMDDEPSRARLGKLGRARVEEELAWSHQERAYLGVYQRLTGRASTSRLHATGPEHVRDRRVLPAGRRPEAGRRHDRPDRAPRAGRRRGSGAHEDERVSVHLGHRRLSIIDLSRRGRPAVAQGRPDARLQRRALQLQGAAGRAEGARRALRAPTPTPRWCSRPGGAGGPTALRRFRGMFAFALADDGDRRARPGPRPARHQAALLPAARRRPASSPPS